MELFEEDMGRIIENHPMIGQRRYIPNVEGVITVESAWLIDGEMQLFGIISPPLDNDGEMVDRIEVPVYLSEPIH